MPGCVLRISGSFDVDTFLRESPFRVLVAYRKGEPRGRRRALHADSGFHVLVGDEERDVGRQCRDAVAFLKTYDAEIRRARAQLGADFAVLDFSTTFRDDVAASIRALRARARCSGGSARPGHRALALSGGVRMNGYARKKPSARTPIVLFLVLFLACAQQQTGVPQPPKQRDRLSEIRNPELAFDAVRSNPSPDPRSLGCYSITLQPDLSRLSRMPATIQLTARPVGHDEIHQHYAVLSGGITSVFWSWEPRPSNEIRVHLGDGFSGWTFELHGTPGGYAGQGRWMNDTLQRESAAASFRSIPCGRAG